MYIYILYFNMDSIRTRTFISFISLVFFILLAIGSGPSTAPAPYVAPPERTIDYNEDFYIDLTSEDAIRSHFDENGTEGIEGIWEYSSDEGPYGSDYKLAIIKRDYKYIGTIISSNNRKFRPGDVKASFETAAVDEILTVQWIMGNKSTIKKVVGKNTDDILIEFNLGGPSALYKAYPKLSSKNKIIKSGEWAGNGSGVVISESGYIITNYHVIEDATEIEVQFIQNEAVMNFNSVIVQEDKINDLAIIKIHDINFNGFDDIPYNFKTKVSDVGTKVYAYGYPLALSLMGKEIKVTDGIISSKTGFDGDITTYQITAPIQPGNSGGPLFDDRLNLIGINSSGLKKSIADNVGYAIKTNYVLNLIDVLPNTIELPNNTRFQSEDITEQIKLLSSYVVLIKVK